MSIKNLNQTVTAGDIVVSDFGVYQHWSLVSDKICENGQPMLISATARNRTVKEESWEVVTQGKPTYPIKVTYDRPIVAALDLARSQIDMWKYSLTTNNCEHFVKWAVGLEVSSKQVVAGVIGATLGAAIVKAYAENPTTIKMLGGSLALGSLLVVGARAIEKNSDA
ncbi:lecithin retinol acyltransferase family protein [Pseudoalteromonas xiamenensis]|uniref:lecithin retinol acyltransferase family protein n=1 Tax=Pseudoalteromonas xiamenensis TaxID=882626 RepID=UPI0035EC2B5E